jgi:signal peptidase I
VDQPAGVLAASFEGPMMAEAKGGSLSQRAGTGVASTGRTSAPLASAQPARTPARPASPPAVEVKDSIREVIETVVFVVVLVLLLKSFVAEAFVIPTGSMAETLYGYQKMVKCPVCHLEFPVNASREADPQQEAQRTQIVGATCPNCRFHITDLSQEWKTGDRVLVGKFLYDFPTPSEHLPRRDDVVVFKYPEEPQRNTVPMNYIKRLKGLPGETIVIHYGKLYVLKGLTYDDSRVPPGDLWQSKFMHKDDERALELFHQGKADILRKSPREMLAVRRLVNDNDFQAKDLVGKVEPRWAAVGTAGSWTPDKVEEPRAFEYDSRGGKDVSWLRYRHLIPDVNRQSARQELICDFMGYNTSEGVGEPPHGQASRNWVGDLMLECEVNVKQAAGELTLELSKGVDRFRARWQLATGTCTLERIDKNGTQKLDSQETSLRKPGKYRLRFADFDDRLTVWVDSSLPFGDGVVYEPPEQRGPTAENDLEPASIGMQEGAVTVSHIRLWRDTYYTVNLSPSLPDAGADVNLADPSDWELLRNLKPRSFYVQPGHFLCFGDNSPESSDSRSWGAVPQRLLLGRALLIYYPFNRAGRIE